MRREDFGRNIHGQFYSKYNIGFVLGKTREFKFEKKLSIRVPDFMSKPFHLQP